MAPSGHAAPTGPVSQAGTQSSIVRPFGLSRKLVHSGAVPVNTMRVPVPGFVTWRHSPCALIVTVWPDGIGVPTCAAARLAVKAIIAAASIPRITEPPWSVRGVPRADYHYRP